MARKPLPRSPDGSAARKSAEFQRVLKELESPDDITRAAAVRSLCPCRSAWGVPIQRYVSAMQDDPCSSVRHEVQHVLHEDSGLGKRLEARHIKEEIAEEIARGIEEDETLPRYSIGWYQRPRPRRARGRPILRPIETDPARWK